MKFLKKINLNLKKIKFNTAIEYKNKSYNYVRFWQFSINLSKKIRKIKTNSRVAVIGHQSIYSYVAMFGTLISGGTYIPISEDIPQERIDNIISLSKCDIIICTNKIKNKIKNKHSRKYFLNIKNLEYENKNFEIPQKINKLAYIIFTSGSTGQPKGVCISRKALDLYVEWLLKNLKIKHKSRCSQFPQIGFDLSVADIFGTITSGGTLIPIRNEIDNLFPGRFIKEKKITHLVCVPSLIDNIKRIGDLNYKNFKLIKEIFFCGEPLLIHHVKSIFEANKNIRIINAYGPTEATCSCTFSILKFNNYKKKSRISMSIGKPNKGMQIKLINEKNRFSNKKGEILILGAQVADGYLKTTENKNKFFKLNKVKTFRTGDLAEKIGGNLYFIDRADNQVKIRGFRVELGEIDFKLNKVGIKQSATIFIDNKIVSFIYKFHNIIKLKKILGRTLPDYMVPNYIFNLKTFPKNQNGKIDKAKLKELALKFIKK